MDGETNFLQNKKFLRGWERGIKQNTNKNSLITRAGQTGTENTSRACSARRPHT